MYESSWRCTTSSSLSDAASRTLSLVLLPVMAVRCCGLVAYLLAFPQIKQCMLNDVSTLLSLLDDTDVDVLSLSTCAACCSLMLALLLSLTAAVVCSTWSMIWYLYFGGKYVFCIWRQGFMNIITSAVQHWVCVGGLLLWAFWHRDPVSCPFLQVYHRWYKDLDPMTVRHSP